MTVVELYKLVELGSMGAVGAFVYKGKPGGFALAAYWTGTFGAPDESAANGFIESVIVGGVDNYNSAASEAACVATARTFFWDDAAQDLYVHFVVDENQLLESVASGKAYGYSDLEAVYVDNVEYLPLLVSAPAVELQADLFNYSMLAFVSGSVVLNAAGGYLDFLIDESVYGSYVKIYDLDIATGKLVYSRSDLVIKQTLFVEDWELSLDKLTLNVQDVRKFFNVDCPTEQFLVADYPDLDPNDAGKVIPLIYGPIRWIKATCTNHETTTGDVEYRAAQVLTVPGDVYVINGESKLLKVPSSTDLATGSFVLASADARDSNGTPLEVVVESATGIAVTYATDVIKALNERYLTIPFANSFYDLDEWAAEETALCEIGVVFSEVKKLFEHIQTVQQGSNVGFRYEITPAGLRTVRIDDWVRGEVMIIPNVQLVNTLDLPVETDSTNLAAFVRVNYNKAWDNGAPQFVDDDSGLDHVTEVYHQQPTVTVDTVIAAEADAIDRAAEVVEHQGDVNPVAQLVLFGLEFVGLKIYEVIGVELTPGQGDFDDYSIVGREYLGFWWVQIVAIAPNFQAKTNTVRAVLLNRMDEGAFWEDENGIDIVTDEDGYAILTGDYT